MASEPWYRFGIFSIRAAPNNVWQMLFAPWQSVAQPPYFLPDGFGGSIFLNAPVLLCIFRPGAGERAVKRAAWIAIALLCAVFWCHGNTGGWQFSYREAITLLPWAFLLILEKSALEPTRRWEIGLATVSIAINAYATFLFLWTNWIQP